MASDTRILTIFCMADIINDIMSLLHECLSGTSVYNRQVTQYLLMHLLLGYPSFETELPNIGCLANSS